MASIRPQATIDFTPDIDKIKIDTTDTSSLFWDLLTRGFTQRFVKNALKASYYYVKQHFWSDEGRPTADAIRNYLKERSLSSAAYTCRLRIGTPVQDTPPPTDVLGLLEAKKREPDLDTFIRVYHPFTPELYVKILTLPETKTDVKMSRAKALTISRPQPEDRKFEDVHVKWGTDVNRMRKLYHEAQIYERLRNKPFQITPKFYGFYQKYSGNDPFAVSVFEHTDVLSIEKEDEPIVM